MTKKKDKLSKFQTALLENIVKTNEVLRNGSSEPVIELIKMGYIKKDKHIFIATDKAENLFK